MPCCVSGILLHINSEIFTDDDTLPDLPYEVKNLDKPQGEKHLDKDTSPIMISSSEQDDSSPLKPTSPVAGQSAPRPMSPSSPRPFETGLMNKTSSPKLKMPKLGKRYVFCDHIILQLNYTKFPITACLCNYLNLFPITVCLQLINIQIVNFSSVDILCGKLAEHVETYQREIISIPGNGYCLINSIIKCMATNFNHKMKQQDLLDQIVDELYENAE